MSDAIKPVTMSKRAQRELEYECAEIMRRLMAKHCRVRPDNPKFFVWSSEDATKFMADFCSAVQYAPAIETAQKYFKWGHK